MPRVPKQMTIVTVEGDEGNLQARALWLSQARAGIPT